ncbi:glucose 1-dehydrogenase [Pelagicoccus sp. NFK12]|uniref:Glucose 1-dehydrogenase n=1 Tax=Pelagicoccus enzymogenes TaxID=2773457 RepID=A0A927IIY1_9BACT|nr:glucose 1-dehydrogenase [Pelagicoccus enzymogenes]MBD5781243.1 glucose 1-dehydrogenase [Pelagicoccus enzymogenes]MDQ8198854.1 glucose 1-dehydrogenase [Pelagicoccus enzymogenes]
MRNAFDLAGQRALITGGGTGIGLGMAKCLVASGAAVVLVGRRESALKEAAAEIGERASYRVFDVTDLAAVPQFVQSVESELGPVDTLINNAGVHLKKEASGISDEEFQTVMQTHVNAAFALSREFGKAMMERGTGNIIFTASMASIFGIPMVAAYSAAKTAHLGLVRALTADFSPRGVRVNAIAPGWIHSEIMHKAVNADPKRKEKILSRTPLGDFGDPEDIGWAAAYLASPAAKFVTGVCLPVDGGASIGF